jgi:hypothetical protein
VAERTGSDPRVGLDEVRDHIGEKPEELDMMDVGANDAVTVGTIRWFIS